MKKTIYKTLLFFLTGVWLLASTGCTQNNGDIGTLFGFWRLTQIDIDGTPDPDYSGNIVWSFQNNILTVNVNGEYHATTEHVATWSEDNNVLTIDFTHWQADQDDAYLYRIPQELRLPEDKPFDLKILSRSSSTMLLEYTTVGGTIQTYRFSKVY